jgi:hypothetical protein
MTRTSTDTTGWTILTSAEAHHIETSLLRARQCDDLTGDHIDAFLAAITGVTNDDGQRTVTRQWVDDKRAVLVHPDHLPAIAAALIWADR